MAVSRLLRTMLLIAGACAPAALLGCGSSAAPVTGTITISGQPPKVAGMGITFMAPDGRSESAAILPDGSYKADRVPVGDTTVAFVYAARGGASSGQTRGGGKGGGKLPKPGANTEAPDIPPDAPTYLYNPIPQPLRDASTSKVKCNVQGGKPNVFNYDIKP